MGYTHPNFQHSRSRSRRITISLIPTLHMHGIPGQLVYRARTELKNQTKPKNTGGQAWWHTLLNAEVRGYYKLEEATGLLSEFGDSMGYTGKTRVKINKMTKDDGGWTGLGQKHQEFKVIFN